MDPVILVINTFINTEQLISYKSSSRCSRMFYPSRQYSSKSIIIIHMTCRMVANKVRDTYFKRNEPYIIFQLFVLKLWLKEYAIIDLTKYWFKKRSLHKHFMELDIFENTRESCLVVCWVSWEKLNRCLFFIELTIKMFTVLILKNIFLKIYLIITFTNFTGKQM